MIAAYTIGRARRILSDDKVPLRGLSKEETEAQRSGLAQIFRLRQKIK